MQAAKERDASFRWNDGGARGRDEMPRIVMKFGGTSMAGIERIRHVAGLVKREAERGNQVAVVVSAMAGETDRLVQLCREAASLYDPARI